MKIFALVVLGTPILHATPSMLTKGEKVFAKEFERATDVTKQSVKFNKKTQHKVQNGHLQALPPVVAYAGQNKTTKWAKSNFSRVNFPNLPQDYICSFRWKLLPPKNPKVAEKAKVYFDMGHRCIRITLDTEKVSLLLENHLVDKSGELKQANKPSSIPLQSRSDLKHQADLWYTVTAEVKDDQVLIQINGKTLYAKHPLIAKARANTYNIDAYGEGYLLDSISVWKAGGLSPTWPQMKAKLVQP